MPSIVTFSLIACLISAPQQPSTSPDRLVYHPKTDIALTLAFGGAWLGMQLANTHLAPTTCKWCDTAPDGSDALNGFDAWGRRNLKWDNTKTAAALSNLTAYALVPVIAYGGDFLAARHDGRSENALADTILISEAWFAASDVSQILKVVTARERPFIHALPPDQKAQAGEPATNNESFPSGHAVLAFSLVTSSAEVASLRGYRRAPWIWRLGLPVAGLTAYFRVAADKHYLTDVIAGAGVGSAIGFGLPYLAHRRKDDNRIPVVRVLPTRGGQMVSAEWVW